MPELANHEKQAIVFQLAQFRSPGEVSRYMRDAFGREIRIQQIVKYDPTRAAYEGGAKWRAIFEVAREQFLQDISNIPAVHQGYRLRLLQKGVGHAESRGDWRLVAQLLQQAAKEVGGAHSNARGLKSEESRRAVEMTPDERRGLLISIIEGVLPRRTL